MRTALVTLFQSDFLSDWPTPNNLNKDEVKRKINKICTTRDAFLIIIAATLGAIVLVQLLIIITCALARKKRNSS